MREKLAPYLNKHRKYQKRHRFQGQIWRFELNEVGDRKVLIKDLLCDGKYICDHIWIHKRITSPIFDGFVPGMHIAFTAEVYLYQRVGDSADEGWDYGLRHIRNVQRVRHAKTNPA